MHRTLSSRQCSLWAMTAAGLGILLLAPRASAQAPTALRVRVVDSAGVAVPEAAVGVVTGLNDVVASAVTDPTGWAALTLTAPAGSYQLVVRRLGFERSDGFFVLTPGTPVALQAVLTPTAAKLAQVTITAEESAKEKAYNIGAEEIARSRRPLVDAEDIIRKLRPEMLRGRSGECPTLSNVWVNGRRESWGFDSALVHVQGTTAMVSGEVAEILRTIRPEHVEHMAYKDCTDTSIPGFHVQNAVFITLKPGVAYSDGRGTYIKLPNIAADTVTLASRMRVLGVFSRTSGQPVADAEVISLRAGLRAHTSATGTVALAFVPEGKSDVCVQKRGYRDTTVAVSISSSDTVPVTLALAAVDTSGAAVRESSVDVCPSDPHTATLRGLVYSNRSGEGLSGADVRLPTLARGTTTDARGLFRFDSLPAGHYLLAIRRLGFAPWQDTVALFAGQQTTRVVVLDLPAALLDTVTVIADRHYISPNLRGFEERRRTGMGYYMTEYQLRKEDGRPLALVLKSHFPGMNIGYGGSGMYLLPSMRCMGIGAAAPPDVYVDGVPWPRPLPMGPSVRGGPISTDTTHKIPGVLAGASVQPIDLSEFQVWDLAAVEYYPDGATLPMQFAGTANACGALLLWTRER